MKFVKIAFLLMTVFLVLTLASCDNYSENASDGLVFGSNGDGTCVLKDLGSCKDTDVVIPSVSPDGDEVVGIAVGAFYSDHMVASVAIPSTVVDIHFDNFIACDLLEKFTVDPDNPVYYSEGNCIIERESKTLIAGCRTSVIPNDVKSIAAYAFRGVSRLESITIPEGVTKIGKAAFMDCDSLTAIDVPASVTVIDEYAFTNCDNLATVTLPDSVTHVGSFAFSHCPKLQSIHIPAGLMLIADDLFSHCTSLNNVVIPDSVVSIDAGAFGSCASLERILIPQNVTELGLGAFSDCSSLSDISFAGTMQQWEEIVKGGPDGEEWWYTSIPATVVHCTDGDVPIE